MTDSIPSTPDKSGEPKRICPACKMELKQNGHYVPPSMMEPGFYICDPSEVRAVESLAPSGESGVPKPILPPLSEMRYMTKEERAEFDAMGPQPKPLLCSQCRERPASSSTPPVSSPEKPKLCAICGTIAVMRYGTPGMDLCGEHAPASPDPALPSSSLPTDEEVERLAAELDDPVTDAILAKIETMPDGREHTSAPTRDLRWLAATIRNLRSRAESFRVAANAVGERNEELERRLDALYTGLTEVQQERDSYHREASKALEALATAERERDEARKELAAREAGDREWNRIQNNLDKLTRGGLEQ